MVFGWLFGYYKKEDVKEELKEEDITEIIPDEPPKLVRQTGIHKGNINEVIFWKNYDEEFSKIEKQINDIQNILNSDEKWQKRLSPVEPLRTIQNNKKKRKRK